MLVIDHTYKVVLGVIGADCHAVGNKILHSLLARAGIEVVNLGVMVSQLEFVTAAVQEKADAILVSSIYGHGEIDCDGLRENCEVAGIGDIILYVGGNLVIGKQDFDTVKRRFEEMGYDRVFPATAEIDKVLLLLKDDIELRRLPGLGHNSQNDTAQWVAL